MFHKVCYNELSVHFFENLAKCLPLTLTSNYELILWERRGNI
jgi:hypothetical protein